MQQLLEIINACHNPDRTYYQILDHHWGLVRTLKNPDRRLNNKTKKHLTYVLVFGTVLAGDLVGSSTDR